MIANARQANVDFCFSLSLSSLSSFFLSIPLSFRLSFGLFAVLVFLSLQLVPHCPWQAPASGNGSQRISNLNQTYFIQSAICQAKQEPLSYCLNRRKAAHCSNNTEGHTLRHSNSTKKDKAMKYYEKIRKKDGFPSFLFCLAHSQVP